MLLKVPLNIFELLIDVGVLVIFAYSSIVEQIGDFIIYCCLISGIQIRYLQLVYYLGKSELGTKKSTINGVSQIPSYFCIPIVFFFYHVFLLVIHFIRLLFLLFNFIHFLWTLWVFIIILLVSIFIFFYLRIQIKLLLFYLLFTHRIIQIYIIITLIFHCRNNFPTVL